MINSETTRLGNVGLLSFLLSPLGRMRHRSDRFRLIKELVLGFKMTMN